MHNKEERQSSPNQKKTARPEMVNIGGGTSKSSEPHRKKEKRTLDTIIVSPSENFPNRNLGRNLSYIPNFESSNGTVKKDIWCSTYNSVLLTSQSNTKAQMNKTSGEKVLQKDSIFEISDSKLNQTGQYSKHSFQNNLNQCEAINESDEFIHTDSGLMGSTILSNKKKDKTEMTNPKNTRMNLEPNKSKNDAPTKTTQTSKNCMPSNRLTGNTYKTYRKSVSKLKMPPKHKIPNFYLVNPDILYRKNNNENLKTDNTLIKKSTNDSNGKLTCIPIKSCQQSFQVKPTCGSGVNNNELDQQKSIGKTSRDLSPSGLLDSLNNSKRKISNTYIPPQELSPDIKKTNSGRLISGANSPLFKLCQSKFGNNNTSDSKSVPRYNSSSQVTRIDKGNDDFHGKVKSGMPSEENLKNRIESGRMIKLKRLMRRKKDDMIKISMEAKTKAQFAAKSRLLMNLDKQIIGHKKAELFYKCKTERHTEISLGTARDSLSNDLVKYALQTGTPQEALEIFVDTAEDSKETRGLMTRYRTIIEEALADAVAESTHFHVYKKHRQVEFDIKSATSKESQQKSRKFERAITRINQRSMAG